ncbi:MAG: hypothetical protein M1814_005165 [Vezdaea aestivalis]|nr:MAG: hypothetical protein M1814_005165 [Vezdaea aestivalis]
MGPGDPSIPLRKVKSEEPNGRSDDRPSASAGPTCIEAPVVSQTLHQPSPTHADQPSQIEPPQIEESKTRRLIKSLSRTVSWWKLAGGTATLILGAVAVPFAIESWRMSKWTQYKDFVEVCAALEDKGASTPQCKTALRKPLPIPSNNRFFSTINARALFGAKKLTRSATPSVSVGIVSWMFSAFFIIFIIVGTTVIVIIFVLLTGSKILNSTGRKESGSADTRHSMPLASQNKSSSTAIAPELIQSLERNLDEKARRRKGPYRTIRPPQASELELLRSKLLRGDVSTLRAHLQGGTDPNIGGEKDGLLIVASIDTPNIEAVNLLIACGVTIPMWSMNGHRRVLSPFATGFFGANTGLEMYMTVVPHLDIQEIENTSFAESGESDCYFSFLYQAAEIATPELCRYLINRGASPSRMTERGESPLMRMAYRGNIEAIRTLLEFRVDVNAKTDEGSTAFKIASRRWSIDICDLLYRHGADINDGRSALRGAARAGNNELCRFLLDRGVDPNESDENGMTALQSAASEGHTEIVSLLLASGAVNEATASYRDTPLVLAISQARVSTFELLFDEKLTLKSSSEQRIALLHRAVGEGDDNSRQSICQRLIDAGILEGPDYESIWLPTPLHLAAVHGLLFCCQLLVSNGADLEYQGRDGTTPLLAACHVGKLDVVRLLLRMGANQNAQDHDGRSALHRLLDQNFDADRHQMYDLAKLCIDAGTDVSLKNLDGLTAFQAQKNKRGYVLTYTDGRLESRYSAATASLY